jgi:1-acyl-sn-glycerol-3-phosphate acyltransferase
MPVEPIRPGPAVSCFPGGHAAARLATWVRLGYEYAVFFLGLLLPAAPLLAWNMLAALASRVLPCRIGAVLGRRVIMLTCRAYLFALTRSGLIKLDLDVLDALRDERSLIIAPNHPALLDVVLMVSRLPHAVCIMKAALGENVLLSRAVGLAGYIRNDSAVATIRRASMTVRAGGQLLIFPEGTRTTRKPVNRFKGGFALIAKTARVPVQTVFIETNSPFLSKGWPIFRKPEFPLIYRARLGRRFEVDGEVRAFVADMESYYRGALTSRLPAA